MAGSILAGTAEHRLDRIETALEVTAGGDRAAVAEAVAQAERMCFVLDALQRAHTVHRTTTIDGVPVG